MTNTISYYATTRYISVIPFHKDGK